MAAKLLKLRKFCMFICAALVLVYLTLLCYANPSKELFFAIALELLSLAGYLYFGQRRAKSDGGRAGDAVLSELSHQYTIVHQWRTFSLGATTAFWLTAALALTIDCFAFCAAFASAQSVSLAVYRAVPISRCLGLHPAASLEVLAGAFVEARKYQRALPLYEEVLSLRLSTFGKSHKEIAAIYCDFGDLYSHENQLVRAESCYRIALAISTALLGDKGSGRAYTRLADCLRDQGRYEEAGRQYQSAYDMRAHQFGNNSAKVGETLAEWAKMLKAQGRVQQAALMQERVASIQNQHREASPLWSAFFSLALFALSLFVSNVFLGRKGILTELAVAKIKDSVDASSHSNSSSTGTGTLSRSQLNRLITLYRFQKKYDEAARYSALLVGLGKD